MDKKIKIYQGTLYYKIYVHFNNFKIKIDNEELAEDIVYWKVDDLIKKFFEKVNNNIKIKVNESDIISISEVKDGQDK